MRLYKNHEFTHSDKVQEFNAAYHEENNPYLLYLQDFEKESFIDEPISEIYDDCEAWCEDNGEEFKKPMFRDTLKEVFGLDTTGVKKVNGKTTRVFKEIW